MLIGGSGGRGRGPSLLDHVSAVDNNREPLACFLSDTVLGAQKRSPAAPFPVPPQMNRTLLDIIRDEEPHGSLFGHKDKKSWKAFRDKLRLKRAGAAWTSSIHVPASDVPIQNGNNSRLTNSYTNSGSRSLMSRRNSVRFTTVSLAESEELTSMSSSRPQMARRTSVRFGSVPSESDESTMNIQAVEDGPPIQSFRPQISRHNSTRFPGEPDHSEDNDMGPAREGSRRLSGALADEREMSAREAVTAQEAAEAAAHEAAAAEEEAQEDGIEGNEEAQPVRMSLMDLLEETDRQMGLVGSRYTVGEDDEEDYDDGEEDEEEGGGGGVEVSCCVCMVRHKGAAFIPCGHTFCRLCSRELWVQRGNCPLCNGYILEILDIF